jgi:hypothetical protein
MIINKSKAKQNKNLLTIVFLCNAHHLQVLGGNKNWFSQVFENFSQLS